MEIIDRIVMLLKEKGVEQKALAEYLGVHPQVIPVTRSIQAGCSETSILLLFF
jgi:transcriptional regulator with XRE-family HTH domain